MEENVILDYLLGELSPEEHEKVHTALVADKQLFKEMLDTEKVLMQVAASKAPASRSGAMPLQLLLTMRDTNGSQQNQKNVIKRPENTRPSLQPHIRVITVAASISIVAAVLFSLFMLNENQLKDQKFTQLLEQKTNLEYEFNSMVAAANQQMTKLAAYSSDKTRVVPLKSTVKDFDYLGNVYWDQETQKVYFDITNLPHTPDGCSYQLWVLIDGKPVDAGLINCHITDLQLAKQLETVIVGNDHVNGFAVTLEKEGGSEVPTLDKMYLYGEI